jgi:hypothetical protein
METILGAIQSKQFEIYRGYRNGHRGDDRRRYTRLDRAGGRTGRRAVSHRLSRGGDSGRFINIPFGAWLIAAPWLLDGIASPLATWNGVISGVLLIVLALPRGRIKDSYAGWDRYVV